MRIKRCNKNGIAQRAVAFHVLTSQQKVKIKVKSAISASQAQRAVKSYTIQDSVANYALAGK